MAFVPLTQHELRRQLLHPEVAASRPAGYVLPARRSRRRRFLGALRPRFA